MSSSGVKPRIAITVGDPAGIGPEIAAKASRDVREIADALAQPRIALAREHLMELADRPLERPIGVDLVGYMGSKAEQKRNRVKLKASLRAASKARP